MAEDRDVLGRVSPVPDFRLAYGPHADHVADVWVPAESRQPARVPLVMIWHGGFWRSAFDQQHLGSMAADLAARGYLVATPEYRRTGDEGGGGWPATFLDVAAAADLLPTAIAEAVPGIIDPTRIIYAGHSAGGHLAVWASLRDRLPIGAPGRIEQLPTVSGILALAPVLNLMEAWRLDLDEGAVALLLGGPPDEIPNRYAMTDPSQFGVPAANLTVVHGDRDGRVPIAMSRQYRDMVGGLLIEIKEGDHFSVIDPLAARWGQVVRALDDLAVVPVGQTLRSRKI
ncbi:MAG: alpha/beta hydrolase family protein [Thermomicrobiales bacterium]